MRVAVIPARGGSKRIVNKNIRLFCGKPIIAYSIELAVSSGLFDKVIVSTDSEEIAKIAACFGAEVPFVRPKDLANDYIGTIPVMAHAINELQMQGCSLSDVCCIYATAPLLQLSYLRQGLIDLQKTDAIYSFSACEFGYSIFRSFKVTAQGRVEMFYPHYYEKRSQDLEKAYHDAGQFYWGKPAAFLQEMPVFSSHSIPIIVPHYLVQDIDTEDDWLRAELLYQLIHKQ